MTPLVSKVRGDVSPKKSLAFTATKSEYLRRFWVFRTVIPRNEPLGAPENCGVKSVYYGNDTGENNGTRGTRVYNRVKAE